MMVACAYSWHYCLLGIGVFGEFGGYLSLFPCDHFISHFVLVREACKAFVTDSFHSFPVFFCDRPSSSLRGRKPL